MAKVKVNFVPPEDQNHKQKRIYQTEPYPAKRNWRKIITSLVVVVLICLAVFSSSIIFSDESLIKDVDNLNFFQKVTHLISGRYRQLAGEKDDRINILLLGVGGTNHESGNLADTIILGSFKPNTNQVAMMSIPRDLTVDSAKYGQVKINAINAYAEAKTKNSGGQATIDTIDSLLNTKIHYYITVDFSGFERIIDEFGGVDIEVERDLVDYQYPILGKEFVYPVENRFETLVIKKGLQHLDGALALKYARSRHAIGIEGSDFARSQRQQKIIMALKEKVFSLDTLLSPSRIKSLLSAYQNHIQTNLELWEILKLAQIGQDINVQNIINQNLTNGDDGLLYADMIDGAYVLLPNDGNFEQIKNLWQYIFYTEKKPAEPLMVNSIVEETVIAESNQTETHLPNINSDYRQETAKIEIQNGTWITGYAGQEKTKLIAKKLNVATAKNADRHDYATTVIYDLSNGDYPLTALELEKIYGVNVIVDIPVTLSSSADFIIILGEN